MLFPRLGAHAAWLGAPHVVGGDPNCMQCPLRMIPTVAALVVPDVDIYRSGHRNKFGTFWSEQARRAVSLVGPVEDIVMNKFAMLGMMLLTAGPAAAQTLAPPATAPAATAPAGDVPAAKAHSPKARATPVDVPVNQRITQMRQELKITAAQQPDWDAFAQVMRDNVTSVEKSYKQRRASVATMSAPDNMRNFAQIEQGRAENIQKLAVSFQTLYDGMSDDQKKTADVMFSHYGDRGSRHKKAPK
jgi:protein CpxP